MFAHNLVNKFGVIHTRTYNTPWNTLFMFFLHISLAHLFSIFVRQCAALRTLFLFGGRLMVDTQAAATQGYYYIESFSFIIYSTFTFIYFSCAFQMNIKKITYQKWNEIQRKEEYKQQIWGRQRKKGARTPFIFTLFLLCYADWKVGGVSFWIELLFVYAYLKYKFIRLIIINTAIF